MADFGYDNTNHGDIAPVFGELARFMRHLNEAHRRPIKVIPNLVPNHASDRHPWSVDSRASPTSSERECFWRVAKVDPPPPNNWTSNFDGSAWERDERTGQYQAFWEEELDLNWRNRQVRPLRRYLQSPVFQRDEGVIVGASPGSEPAT